MNLPRRVLTLLLASVPALLHAEPPLPVAKPEEVGASAERLDRIDAVVKQALDRGDAPGAVVLDHAPRPHHLPPRLRPPQQAAGRSRR